MLELLVGNIASGKSTYSKEAAGRGCVIVNNDAIVTAIHGGNYQLYNHTYKPIYKAVENTIITVALSLGRDVVVDNTNNTRKTRRRYIGLAHSLDAEVRVREFLWMAPLIHARRRSISDGRGYSTEYWLKVADRKSGDYEKPDIELEGFDELIGDC